MPAIVTPLIASLGAAIGGTVGAFMVMNAAAVATGVLFVGGMAYSAYQKRKAKAAYNASLQDRLVNVDTALAPRELVLGRVRKGGPVFFRGSCGDKKETFVMCIALAAHEIDAVEAIYFNEEPVTLDGDGYVTSEPWTLTGATSATPETFTGTSITLAHTPTSDAVVQVSGAGYEGSIPFTRTGADITVAAEYDGIEKAVNYQYSDGASKARVRWHLGADDQAADARLIELFPDQWTADHRARGVAYLIVELTYDDTVFAGGIPTVTALVRGAKVIDPRVGLTPAWSENPAILAANVYLHEAFGATPLGAAEIDRITAAANDCDIEHDYLVDGVTTTRALYTAGLVASYGTPARDVIDDLVQAMAGHWAHAQGQLFIKAGVYHAPVLELDESALAGVARGLGDDEPRRVPVSVQVHRAQVDKFNTVAGALSDEEQDYKVVPMPQVSGAALVTRDGGALVQDVQFGAITYGPQAQHVAGVMLRDARDPLVVTASFNLRAYPVELFDCIDLSIAAYGWSPKSFLVVGRTWSLDGLVQLTLKETAAAIYEPDAEFLPGGYASNTALPRPWELPTVDIVSVTSGASTALLQADGTVVARMLVAWAAVQSAAIAAGGFVEVQYRLASDTAWRSEQVGGAETQVYIPVPDDGAYYVLRARGRTTYGPGLWGVQVGHQLGSGGPAPANYDTFSVVEAADGTRVFDAAYTTTTPPADLAGGMVRFVGPGATGSEAWAAMTDLTSGPVPVWPRESRAGAAGAYRFALRAQTRSGVLCDVADTRYVNITLAAVPTGAAAELLTIAQTGNTLSFTSAGTPYPAAETITFTAQLQNLSGTVTWGATAYDASGVSQGAVTLGGSGNTCTLTSAQFLADPDTQFVVVTATLGSHTASARVVKLTDGAEPIITLLLPQACTVPASSAGVVSAWSAAVSQAYVLQGNTQITSGISFAIAPSGNPDALTGPYTGSSPLNTTTGAVSVTGAGSWSNSSNSTSLTVRMTHTASGAYRDATFTITKAVAGADGLAGISWEFSNPAHSVPADASGNVSSYTGSGTTIKVYEGSTALTYHTSLAASRFTIGTPTINPAAAITAGAISGSGTTTATVADHSGMSAAQAVVTITYPITVRRASGTDVTFNLIQTITKSLTGAAGSAGSNNATVPMYQRTASSSAPALPSGTMTYTFATAALSGGAPGSWTQTIPASGGSYLWVTQAVASSNTATDSIAAADWSAARLLATDGATGATGTRGTRTLYPQSASYTSSYNNGAGAGLPSYKAQATTLIASATTGLTPTTPIAGDVVSFSNGTSYSITLIADSTYATNGNNCWSQLTQVIDGSLIVTGTLNVGALAAGERTGVNGTFSLDTNASTGTNELLRLTRDAANTDPLVLIYDKYDAAATNGPALKLMSDEGRILYIQCPVSNESSAPIFITDGRVGSRTTDFFWINGRLTVAGDRFKIDSGTFNFNGTDMDPPNGSIRNLWRSDGEWRPLELVNGSTAFTGTLPTTAIANKRGGGTAIRWLSMYVSNGHASTPTEEWVEWPVFAVNSFSS